MLQCLFTGCVLSTAKSRLVQEALLAPAVHRSSVGALILSECSSFASLVLITVHCSLTGTAEGQEDQLLGGVH